MKWIVLPLCACLAGCSSSSSDDTATGDPQTVKMEMAKFTVMPGQEVWKCQDFANPFGGGDTKVTSWRAKLTGTSHHLLVTLRDSAVDTGVSDCGQANLDGQVFDAQTQVSETTYPAGVAFTVPEGYGFRIEAHYLNSGDTPFDASVEIEAVTDESSDELISAGPLLITSSDISIPPGGAPTTITKTCTLDKDMTLVEAVSHMHKRGTRFTVMHAGALIYEETDYAHPTRKIYDPPLQMKKGDGVTFACTYVNNGTSTITFGQSADTDEMCAMFGTYYPAPVGREAFYTCFVDGNGPPPGQ
jgi:hypothetical protein